MSNEYFTIITFVKNTIWCACFPFENMVRKQRFSVDLYNIFIGDLSGLSPQIFKYFSYTVSMSLRKNSLAVLNALLALEGG